MTESQKTELTREGVLSDLHAVAPQSLPAGTLLRGRRVAGIAITEGELDRHLDYLEGKGLIERSASGVSAASVRFKLTSAGVDYCEVNEL
jgi:hypothetical protein